VPQVLHGRPRHSILRLRTPVEAVTRVITPMAHRCPRHAIVLKMRRHAVGIECRMVDGTPSRFKTVRRHSQGDVVTNRISMGWRNATYERLAAPTHRGRVLALRAPTLKYGMYGVGSLYNFCTHHARFGLCDLPQLIYQHRGREVSVPALRSLIINWRTHDICVSH
jgi:hypothetical protein